MARTRRKTVANDRNPASRTPRGLAREIMSGGGHDPTNYCAAIAEILLVPLLSSGIEEALNKVQELASQNCEHMELPEQLKNTEPREIRHALVYVERVITNYLHVERIRRHSP
jgi:hypothetical protein